MAFQAQSTQYFAVALQVTVDLFVSELFSIELPMSVASIVVTGATSHTVSTSSQSAFDDTDAAGVGVNVNVQPAADQPAAGTRTLTFTVTGAGHISRWWVVEADNGAGGQTSFKVRTQGNAVIGRLLGDPSVTVPAAPFAFTSSKPLVLTGAVDHGVFVSAGAPAGAPALPPILGLWKQVPPEIVSVDLGMSPTAPDSTTHQVSSPSNVVAPDVPAQVELQFGLIGSYGTAARPIATNEADAAVIISPRASASPVKLASGLTRPGNLLVDANNVYWTALDSGAVMKVPIGGGTATVLASEQNSPFGLAVDATNVYWTNVGTQPGGFLDGTVIKVPIGGGTPVLLVSKQFEPWGLAVDATSLYWTTDSGELMKAPIAGGDAVTLSSSSSRGLSVVVADATNVYWATDDGRVLKAPIGGGDAVTLASGQHGLWGLAVDATHVYWADDLGLSGETSGTIRKVPIAGGEPIVLATGQAQPQAIAVDAMNVYWANRGTSANRYADGAIMKVALGGDTPVAVATGQQAARRIALDATTVYWTNDPTVDHGSDGALMKTAK